MDIIGNKWWAIKLAIFRVITNTKMWFTIYWARGTILRREYRVVRYLNCPIINNGTDMNALRLGGKYNGCNSCT